MDSTRFSAQASAELPCINNRVRRLVEGLDNNESLHSLFAVVIEMAKVLESQGIPCKNMVKMFEDVETEEHELRGRDIYEHALDEFPDEDSIKHTFKKIEDLDNEIRSANDELEKVLEDRAPKVEAGLQRLREAEEFAKLADAMFAGISDSKSEGSDKDDAE